MKTKKNNNDILMNDQIKDLPFILPIEWSETTKKIILENSFGDITEYLKNKEWLLSMAQDLKDDNSGLIDVFGLDDLLVKKYKVTIKEIEQTAKDL